MGKTGNRWMKQKKRKVTKKQRIIWFNECRTSQKDNREKKNQNLISMKKDLIVKDININFFSQKEKDFISLTDIAKYKNKEKTGLVISHWLSTRYTIEFMGIWEQLHNLNFNVTEFRNIKNESGSNGYILSSKQWREKNKNKAGNIRDYADVRQLVCLANLESLNAEFIRQKLSQSKRLKKLNQIAIIQMRSLIGNKSVKKLR